MTNAGSRTIMLAMTGLMILMAATAHSVAIAPALAFGAIVMVDGLLSRWADRRLELSVHLRRDVVEVGSAVSVDVTAQHVTPLMRVSIGMAATDGRRVSVQAGPAELELRAHRIGVVTHLDVVVSASVLRILPYETERRVRLAAPLYVGPRIEPTDAVLPGGGAGGLTATRRYEPGDRPNRINWAATARTGDLLVRSSGTTDGELVVVVEDSSSALGDTDRAWLSRPASAINQWWIETSGDVRLITREATERSLRSGSDTERRTQTVAAADSIVVDATVSGHDELLWRLSRVVPGATRRADDPGAMVFTPSGEDEVVS